MASAATGDNCPMHYTLIRNAAALLEIGGQRFLIDPAIDRAGARPPVPNTPQPRPNPLVDLPEGWQALVEPADALVVTHLHQDHWDATSAATLDKLLPLFGQPEDVDRLRAQGFSDLRPVEGEATFGDVTIARTAGHHGTGAIGRAMAPVSGFVFAAPGEPTVYVAGDTIWCDEVAEAIGRHRPEVIVVNAGGARFLEGDPIVMTAEDVARVHGAAPEATIVVVHLEAINHCLETRDHYRETLPALGVDMARIRIPEDGETVEATT
jgi:L-ascorbate metabolism protein UlaG (beta-lactamase superfamily)